ncbi:MAG: hypothetical protein H7A01_13330 [Hahellaceae bacterium]|jgi:hypothetical protein|nr:hypothetical protein [Hahellaceae bacterium]MCP5209698.1 hypothetical protein [Hahellaceae bacterium]
MIQGLDTFREYFKGFEDRYTLIGGVACYLYMENAGVDFRATRDLDIVLCAEALDAEFVKQFWAFVKAANYEHQARYSGNKQYYRFSKPVSNDYPQMIELFSRKPDDLLLKFDNGLTPIPVDESVCSLSAILLDEDYYQCLRSGTEVLNGLPLLKVEFLVPFKMRAWADLSKRKSAGESVDSKSIKKHKYDVFKISQLLIPEQIVPLADSIKTDVASFIEAMASEKTDLKGIGLHGLTIDQILDNLVRIYGLR